MIEASRRVRWERRTEWPLTAVAVVFLAAYAWPILQQDLPANVVTACEIATWCAWAVFAIDYGVRIRLSEDWKAFVRGNLIDLAVIVLPLLRPLRLLRLLALVAVLNRQVGGSVRGRVAVYVGGATTLVLFVSALAILDAERQAPEANITGFEDALWWAMTTVTTVGYGDRYPTTGADRLVAAGLMLAGIALLGIVTASLASWLLDKVREVEEQSQAATQRDLEALTAEVRAVREELARLGSPR